MKLFRGFMALVFLVSFPAAVWSQELSEQQVWGFVNVMQEFKPLFEQYAEAADDDGDVASTSKLVTDWAREFTWSPDMLALLDKYGFDRETWPVVASRVTQAYMAVKFGEEGGDALGQMRKIVREIEDSRDIPAEQKEQMIGQMKENMAEMEKTLNAPAGDQNAVRAFIPQLDAVFDWHD